MWTAFACDSTGQNITGVASDIGVLFSKDYGQTFRYTYYYYDYPFYAVAMSADSKVQYVAAYGEFIYISTTYGHYWKELTVMETDKINWQALATSADGSYVFAAVMVGPIYYSHDSGSTWALSSKCVCCG